MQIFSFEINTHSTKEAKNPLIDDIYDIKDFKKILRTKTNVLVCFTNSPKQIGPLLKVVRDVAQAVKGQGTLILMDCSGYVFLYFVNFF